MTLNLATLYEAVAEAIPERTAIVGSDERFTFAELDAAADRVAAWLIGAGIEPGAHVGMQMLNSAAFVQIMLGCFKARVVPINVNFRYTEHELEYLFANSDLAALFVDSEFEGAAAEAAATVPTLTRAVVFGDRVDPADWGAVQVTPFADVDASDPAGAQARRERSTDDRFVLYTGGTTGQPKGAVWRQEDLFFAALSGGNSYGAPRRSAAELGAAAPQMPPLVYVVCAPLIHGAASFMLFSGLFMGASQVLLRKFSGEAALAALEAEKGNLLVVVGDAMARPVVDALGADPAARDLSAWMALGSGGAILSPSTIESLQRLRPGIVIRDSFGASESGTDGEAKIAPDGQITIADADTIALVRADLTRIPKDSDEIGYIARTGHVPVGYYNDEAKSAATFPVIDGVRWSVLGDMARYGEPGRIVVLGRGSQCINSGGEKVFPEEVEQALKAHPSVYDALVVGVPDETYGQRVGAVVELRDGFAPDLDAIRTHCRSMIAGYKVPANITVVTQMHRSPSGKADYRWAGRVLTEGANR